MTDVIADLQLHSKYSRAVSKDMVFPMMERWGRTKGIGLLATGDWTHPLWFREIEANLTEIGNGLLELKAGKQQNGTDGEQSTRFLLATEVSSIYKQGNKLRRVHTLIWVPSIASARRINQEFVKRGCNLMSDGRPIMGLPCMQIAELVLTIEPKALIIPAHAWTPWFAVYGSLGGFDSLIEAFGEFAKNIYAVETGLSSNPSMNWRIAELDTRSIVSFSDAHSGPKLGREATVFTTSDTFEQFGYQHIFDAITEPKRTHDSQFGNNPLYQAKTDTRIAYTIEFYPDEGKYHYTGHRACNVRYTPEETKSRGDTCPVCGKRLTVGVMERIEALASRSEESLVLQTKNEPFIDPQVPLQVTRSTSFASRPPFVMMVPLLEIIAECLDVGVASKKVQALYDLLISQFGSEYTVLLRTPMHDIAKVVGTRIAEGIHKVRVGDLMIDPGYDGVFGVVTLWGNGEHRPLVDTSREQLGMF